MESAFGYDITNISTNVNESTGGNNEDSPRSEIVSQFPKGLVKCDYHVIQND